MAVAGKIVHYSPPELAQPIAPADILTPKELAARLQVPISWIYKHTDSTSRRSRLPVLYVDGFLRFDWNEVCAWMRQNRKA